MNDFGNEQVKNLPRHLKQFIVDQRYERYTSVDQAVWRYVMRQNYATLKHIAYYPYIKGLRRAGITIERIPDLMSMNRELGKIGWGAVTVDGFIPPSAFMEFQAYRVLVIAADIRQLHHIQYTPAPDIIHESAGHAPIIADPEYARYLSYIGEIGTKAMFSLKDFELYEVIRRLSIVKEMPGDHEAEIRRLELEVWEKQANLGEPSEMALLSRLHWWTVEYGLIGDLESPKIYGAGLLSSIGESVSCMRPEVKKYGYTAEAIQVPFDITKEQPQLFVTPDFKTLVDVLDAFAATMAFRKGGIDSVAKAVACKNVCTVAFETGLQVSGVFASAHQTSANSRADDAPIILQTTGPTALSSTDKALKGFGKYTFAKGLVVITGYKAQKYQETFASTTAGAAMTLQWSDLEITGVFQETFILNDTPLFALLTDVKLADSTVGKLGLTEASRSVPVLLIAIAQSVVSVFNGAADKEAYEQSPTIGTSSRSITEVEISNPPLSEFYGQVRAIRERETELACLSPIWQEIKTNLTDGWLCALEMLELITEREGDETLGEEIRDQLHAFLSKNPSYQKLIDDGLLLIGKSIIQDHPLA